MVLGKMVSLYLSDREARDLRAFCDENQCTQYNALKTAVNNLLYQPKIIEEKDYQEPIEENTEMLVEIQESDEIEEESPVDVSFRILDLLREKYQTE